MNFQIQKEFIKHAFWWSNLSPTAKRFYLGQHPNSKIVGQRVIYNSPKGHQWGTVKRFKNNVVRILDDATNQQIDLSPSAIIASNNTYNFWDTYSPEQQTSYLTQHPQSKKHLHRQISPYPTENPHYIAKTLNIIYNGYQPENRMYTFTDPITKSTFYARNLEETEAKIEEKQKLFFNKPLNKTTPLQYASIIRSEFVKLSKCRFIKHANWWSRLSQDEKRKYLMMHPGSSLPESGDVEFDHPSGHKSQGTIVEAMKNNLYKILDKLTGEHVLVPESALAI